MVRLAKAQNLPRQIGESIAVGRFCVVVGAVSLDCPVHDGLTASSIHVEARWQLLTWRDVRSIMILETFPNLSVSCAYPSPNCVDNGAICVTFPNYF
jgi:hypothetical protein